MAGEPIEQPQPPVLKQPDAPPVYTAEGPRDNKNRIIARLKNISRVVTSVNEAQSESAKAHPSNIRAAELVKLGNGYTAYLEAHIDEVADDKTFQAIASLAKTSMLMNIEQYAATIRGISGFVAQHQELNNLNPQGKTDGPWSNIKEALYFSSNNDVREQFREGILSGAKALIESGDFDARDVDHLERFLSDPKGRLPSEFIPEYLERHTDAIRQWTPLTLDDFQEHVVTHIGDLQGDISQNGYLKQLDEEIASIKPKNLQESKALAKTRFVEREKKLAFIRDLRFGRVDIEVVKRDVAKRAGEITRRPDLKTLGPHLKKLYTPFLETLRSTAGTDLEMRKATLTALVESYPLDPMAKQAVLDYLSSNLK